MVATLGTACAAPARPATDPATDAAPDAPAVAGVPAAPTEPVAGVPTGGKVLGAAALDRPTVVPPAGPDPTTPQPFPEPRLGPGDCLVIPPADDDGRVPPPQVVDCDLAHDAQVFAVLVVDLDTYPGDAELRALADDGCLARFEPALGRPYATSGLEIVHLRPSPLAWRGGERDVVCAVIDLTGAPLDGDLGVAR